MPLRVVTATLGVLLAAGLVAAVTAAPASATAAPPAKATPYAPSTLRAGTMLHLGQHLESPGGAYDAHLTKNGRLVVDRADGSRVWSTSAGGSRAHVSVTRTGQMWVVVGGTVRWATRTYGSGTHDVLTLRRDGVLALTNGSVLVWSSAIGNGCPSTRGKTFTVDLSAQFGRMCANGQQLRTTYVTSGATAEGDATPTGTWHVQARIRNTTLYPAGGGAYPVKYWVPYDGAYGVHDSPWQTFAYGSSKYRTQGSHGCVHLPGATMAWFYGWARVGTTVTIHA